MKPTAERNELVNIWTARVIPLVMAGVVAYATYVAVALLSVDYLLVKHNDKRAAIPILVIYFSLFLPMTVSFLRLFYITTFDPPYVPLGPAAIREKGLRKEKTKIRFEEDGVGGGEYQSNNDKEDPDSPGLELFYTKNVFVTEADGKPVWCSYCATWKPDRAHHDSSSGRCIKKMDHFCPWVGGPIGETNFKFFIQLTLWTALYCLHLLIVMAFYIRQQLTSQDESLNKQFVAIIALAGFFCLFTASMAGTSINLALKNLTTVERLNAKTKLYTLAVLKPPLEKCLPYWAQHARYSEITYPLGSPQISEDHAVRASPPPPQALSSTYATNQSIPPITASTENRIVAQPASSSQAATENPLGNNPSRDLQATRTFAILNMLESGQNPWDLGSALLNWKTVMGMSVIEWFLLTKSPCSNHEDTESHFAIGPNVDALKVHYCFTEPNETRNNGMQTKASNSIQGVSNQKSVTGNNKSQGGPQRGWLRKGNPANKSKAPGSDDQIKMEELNVHTN